MADSGLAAAFSRHPKVCAVVGEPASGVVSWSQGTWHRSIGVGCKAEVRGLVETIDNNPMVCCDSFAVPGPAATMALLALAPASRAGLVGPGAELRVSLGPEPEFDAFLFEADVPQCTTSDFESELCAAEARFSLTPGSCLADLEAAYREYYDRAFYVRLGDHNPSGTAFASVRLANFDGSAVVTAAADPRGKAGASQVVHAFNVMCGFVESLGVTDPCDL